MRKICAFLALLLPSSECLAGNPCSTHKECLEYVFTIPGRAYCMKKGGFKYMFVKKQKVIPRITYVCNNGKNFHLPHY